MPLSPWLKPASRRPTVRLRLERLEDRDVPTAAAYGELPLAFEVNQGQADAAVDFLARGAGYAVALSPTGATLALTHGKSGGDALRLQLVGANPAARPAGQDPLASRTNYLIGSDPRQWHTDVANYAAVTYAGVYPGVDLVYYGNRGRLEYDFVVAPGADPGVIRLDVLGSRGIALDAGGNLVLRTSAADLVQHAPVVYQAIDGVRRPVSGEFVLTGDKQVGFRLGAYDPAVPLVIDPVLSYSTYLGGSGNEDGRGIAVDAAGSAYVTGATTSTNFVTTVGAFQRGAAGGQDVYVAKLNPTGSGLVYATYIGGTSDDAAYGIAVDSAGSAWVTGPTASNNFPTTATAFQPAPAMPGAVSTFLTRLNANGSGLLYSTYFGGTFTEAMAVAVGPADNAYITGWTIDDIPTTPGAFQATNPFYYSGSNQGFVARFDASQAGAASLVYSTYLGGTEVDTNPNDIAVDAAGNAYVAGWTSAGDFPTTPGAFQRTRSGSSYDAFLTKLNPAGSALVYSTYLGGTWDDLGHSVAVDAAGNAYVAGGTYSPDLPTTAGAYQPTANNPTGQVQNRAFVSKVNAAGSGLVYSTYVSGNYVYGQGSVARAIAVAADGIAVITGETSLASFPTQNAVQPAFGGYYDAFVTALNPAGSGLAYSTFLGGAAGDFGSGVAVDTAGNAYVVGSTESANFPTAGALQPTRGGGDDAFVAKLDAATNRAIDVTGFPTATTAGVPGSVTVTVKDAGGAPLTGYTGTVHFSSTDRQAGLPADYTFTAADQGTKTFPVTLKTAGTQSITVTDVAQGTISGSQTGITVTPAAASKLTVTAPASVKARAKFSVTVTLLDAYGNVATGYTGRVTFTSTDSSATLPTSYTFTAGDQGVHTFTNLVLTRKGTQKITVTDTLNSLLTGSATVSVK